MHPHEGKVGHFNLDDADTKEAVMSNRVHLVSEGNTIEIDVATLTMTWRGRVIIKVNGKQHTLFNVGPMVTTHTFTLPKKGLREPGDEVDEYEVELRFKRGYFLDQYSFTVRRNGHVLHSD